MYREGENDGHCAEGQLALSQQPDEYNNVALSSNSSR